jgi:hypothetical protein
VQWQPGRPGWRGLAILFFLRPRGLAAEDDQSEEQQRKDAGGCRGPLRQHHGASHTPRQGGRRPIERGSFWFEGVAGASTFERTYMPPITHPCDHVSWT